MKKNQSELTISAGYLHTVGLKSDSTVSATKNRNKDNEKVERFYRAEHGLIFKHNEETMKLFVLNKRFEWEEEPRLNTINYDAGSNYIEILNPLLDPDDAANEIRKLLAADKSD